MESKDNYIIFIESIPFNPNLPIQTVKYFNQEQESSNEENNEDENNNKREV